MPAAVIAAGLGLLAALAVAAVRLPAPHVSEAAWQCAKVAVIPVSLLWMVSMTVVARPTAFAFAMVSGMGCCAVAWVMRAPPEAVRRRDDRRPDGGDDDDGSAPGGGPGGLGAVDWDAFERAAFDAWRAAAAAEARRRR